MNYNDYHIDSSLVTRVFALGGLEEIGKNTYCIEHNEELIIIDAGVKFPNKSNIKRLGVQAIIPDYSYLIEMNYKIKALFITHGHEDHIGAIIYLLQKVKIPFIYAPRLAAAMIRDRLKEHKLKDLTVVNDINELGKVKTKNFLISYFAINHSIPDAYGIAINTPNGLVVTTGDYKFDWTPLGHNSDLKRLVALGAANDGVNLLMADSTNSEVAGYNVTEKTIINNLYEIIHQAPGRVLLSTFASNVHRIQHVVKIAAKCNRKVVVAGRSIERIIRIIRQMGHLKIQNSLFISDKEIKQYKDHQILILCTGSQGEEVAALARMANGTHNVISIKTTDSIIFSSSTIPGNKVEVESVVNKLVKKGATVYENNKPLRIHTSGHASQEEQKLLFNLLKPRFFMPMHGDYRMLKKHGETAVSVNVKPENVFICANGDTINLFQDKAWIGERVPADPIYIDGRDMSGQAYFVIRDREVLAKNGVITVVAIIDSKSNKLLKATRVIMRGVLSVKSHNYLISKMINISNDAVKEVLNGKHPTFFHIKKAIKTKLAPYVFKVKKINPMIIPVILDQKH